MKVSVILPIIALVGLIPFTIAQDDNLQERISNLQERISNLQERISNLQNDVIRHEAKKAEFQALVNKHESKIIEKSLEIERLEDRINELHPDNQFNSIIEKMSKYQAKYYELNDELSKLMPSSIKSDISVLNPFFKPDKLVYEQDDIITMTGILPEPYTQIDLFRLYYYNTTDGVKDNQHITNVMDYYGGARPGYTLDRGFKLLWNERVYTVQIDLSQYDIPTDRINEYFVQVRISGDGAVRLTESIIIQ